MSGHESPHPQTVWVVVRESAASGAVEVVVGVLEQAGVDAVVGSPGSADVYPMPSIHPFRILVKQSDMTRAREVLAQLEAMPEEADEED